MQRGTKSFQQVEKQLDRLCDQMQLLHNKISDLQVRQKRAAKRQQKEVCSLLHIQLGVLKGAYNIYHRTADRKCRELEDMEVPSRD